MPVYPCSEGQREPQSWSMRAAAVPQPVRRSQGWTAVSHPKNRTVTQHLLCWLLGKSEGIPGVIQPPWLLFCRIHAGVFPRVQLSPVGDNNHITLLRFPSFLHKTPITTLTFSSCAQSEKIKALIIFMCSVTL